MQLSKSACTARSPLPELRVVVRRGSAVDAHRKAYSRLNGHENSRPGLSHRVGEKSLKSSSQAIEIGSDFFRKMLSPKTNLCASKS